VSQGTFSVSPALLHGLSKELEQIHSMVGDGTTASIANYAAGVAVSTIVEALWDFYWNAGSKRDAFSNKLTTFSHNLADAADSYDYVDHHVAPASTP
jgi:hypothetical protein